MTKIKLCGLSSPLDIEAANSLRPDYVGFVFAPKSKRYVSPEQAGMLRRLLAPGIQAAGVFVDEDPQRIAALLNDGVIDIAQLHGSEEEPFIRLLRTLTDKPLIQAFRVSTPGDIKRAGASTADFILLDSGAGTGTTFDWTLLRDLRRPYFLAGGLSPLNVKNAVRCLTPYGVDVSSGIETNGRKDKDKMAAFVAAVRKEDNL